jgi:aryl-alcohol dehydrogenase-like predicted oxidoreductase
LKKLGKVRFIGTSGQLPELIPAAKSWVFDVILTYNTFNLLVQDANDELFPLARKKNIGIILGGALYQGLLTGNPEFVLKKKEDFYEKEDPAYYRTEELMARLNRLMKYVKGDASALRQLAFRFALSEPVVSVVVTAMRSVEEVEENVAASDKGPLTQDETNEIMVVLNKDRQAN